MKIDAETPKPQTGRRLLSASKRPQRPRGGGAQPQGGLLESRKLAIVFTAIAVPLIALTVYMSQGKPDQREADGQAGPAQTDDAHPGTNEDKALVERLAAAMEKNPDDPAGWTLLGDAYVRLQRFSDATQAYARALEKKGPDASLLSSLGEALVFESDGRVGDEARYAFSEAQKLGAGDPRAAYFLALAKAQDGDYSGAVEDWAALLEKTPEGAPYRAMIQQQIERAGRAMMSQLGGGDGVAAEASAPPIDAETAQAVAGMSAEDRARTIQAMVDGLAARLKDNPDDLQGWLRLGRSYVVLGQRDKAVAAFDQALVHFKDDFAALAELTRVRADLGLPPA